MTTGAMNYVPQPDQPYEIGCSTVRRYAVKDAHTARKALNDNLVEVLTRELGLQRSFRHTNMRLLCAMISVAAGIISHFAPIPFPENVWLLVLCIVVYYVCCGVILYISRFLERDAFFVGSRGGAGGKVLRLCSSCEQFKPQYNIKAELVTSVGWLFPSTAGKGTSVAHEWPLGRFFTEDGLIYPPAVRTAVAELLGELKFA